MWVCNRFCDSQNWDTIFKIINRLGAEGMSGDETDTPTGVYPKAVRHIEIPWISPRISQLFEAVDSYESSLRVETMRSHVGNAPLHRHYEPRSKNIRAKVIPHLPRNWYDDAWFKGLLAGQRTVLSVIADVEIPTLVSAIFFMHDLELMDIPEALLLTVLWSLLSGPLTAPLTGPLVAHSYIFHNRGKICR
jgi:hypothetical protein